MRVTRRAFVAGGVASAALAAPAAAAAAAAPATPSFSATKSFTFSLAQANEIGTFTPSAAMAATIPTNASVAFPIDTIIGLQNYSKQTVTITPAKGVTLLQAGSTVSGPVSMGTYASGAIRQVATNVWIYS